MVALLGFLKTVFWGLITLSVLVFIHEGGHYLAARTCGVRVTEFFLGLPCRFNIHHVSRRNGTKFGITPLLLGGYAAICGMDPTDVPCAPAVLAGVHRKGTATVDELAESLSLSSEEVQDACALLSEWGSIAPVYDESKGERPNSGYYPSCYSSVARDASGLTILDGRAFDRDHASVAGDPWTGFAKAREFFESERSRTYCGKTFLPRAFMLVAGILVNIACGFLLLMCVYSLIGVNVSVDSNVIGSVDSGSIAAKLGIEAGDAIVSVGGEKTATWTDLVSELDNHKDGNEFELVYRHGGREKSGSVALGKDDHLGIAASTQTVRVSPLRSLKLSWDYIALTAKGVASLLIPQQAKQVLDNSTSIVGISVMSSEAADAGIASYLSFAALISLSLGFMNLLPIPPLDGGKLLIEVIQLVLHRELSLKVQNVVSLIGIGLFGLLFVYMLRADIIRFIL